MKKIFLFTIKSNLLAIDNQPNFLIQNADKYKNIKDTELKRHFKNITIEDNDKRNSLWKIKDTNIYAYPCLKKDEIDKYRNNFIFSILNTIAFIDFDNDMNKMFSENKFYLILHEKDIGFREANNYFLSEKERQDFIFENNPDLKEYNIKLDAFVFQHTKGAIIKLILKGREDGKINEEKIFNTLKQCR